ncbi:hypothetical protein ID866_6828 [Astraeus odoratus]|nr:hypothetical protein ID866_6828 [Astraeus odoratus]
MAIDGLIILDANGRPIIQSGYTSFAPAYPLLHVDALNNELSKASPSGCVDPVIYVSAGGGDMPDGSACCHIQLGEMRMLVSISGDGRWPLVQLDRREEINLSFHEILQDYFGTVSTVTLKDNFDIVYQLIEEALDSSGHPLTTSPSILRDIVLPPSLLSKLLASLSATTPSSGRSVGPTSSSIAGSAFSSPIPWRKAGLRYAHNEILFDIAEEMRSIIGRNGATLVSNVFGRIESNSRLSGMPDLLMSFTNVNVMIDCAFHPCVRLQRWKRDKTLSFIPPDGKFVLAEYQYASPQSGVVSNLPLPLSLKSNIAVNDSGGNFVVTFTSRMMKAMENVKIEWYLGEDASNSQYTAVGNTEHAFVR